MSLTHVSIIKLACTNIFTHEAFKFIHHVLICYYRELILDILRNIYEYVLQEKLSNLLIDSVLIADFCNSPFVRDITVYPVE